MCTITPSTYPAQTDSAVGLPEPSAYGGVLLLAQLWATLGGDRLMSGIRWQGRASPLLLFALVVWPVLAGASVRAVSVLCAKTTDPLLRLLGWYTVVTQRRLVRFVDSPRHDWGHLLGILVELLSSHPALVMGKAGIIAVDSTTVEKHYGPKLAGIRPVYDATQRRLVDGYEIVSACAVEAARCLPIGLVPHRKAETAAERAALKRRRRKAGDGEWPSKLDLALILITRACAAGVGSATVVGDSAFAVMWWLREIEALGRHWLVATRQDRRLRIGAEIRAIRDWVPGLALTPVTAGANDGSTLYGALLPQAVLLERHCNTRGLRCRPVYFERRNKRGKVVHRWYLLTDQLGWGLETLWLHWSWRWAIEQLHRESKQHLHLAAFHAQTWEGIVAWITCTSMRASLLYAMRAIEPTCGNLSLEGLVAALRQAACHVQVSAEEGQAVASIPPTLPSALLWQEAQLPLPAQWWPIVLKAA